MRRGKEEGNRRLEERSQIRREIIDQRRGRRSEWDVVGEGESANGRIEKLVARWSLCFLFDENDDNAERE